jgi:hypothetical protein
MKNVWSNNIQQRAFGSFLARLQPVADHILKMTQRKIYRISPQYLIFNKEKDNDR